MACWTLIYRKNSPTRAKSAAVPYSFWCQVMWFSLASENKQNQGTSKFLKPLKFDYLILLFFLVCIAYPGVLHQEIHSERFHILCLPSRAVQRGKHTLKHFQADPYWDVLVSFAGRAYCVSTAFLWGWDFSRNNGRIGLQTLRYPSPQSIRNFLHILNLRGQFIIIIFLIEVYKVCRPKIQVLCCFFFFFLQRTEFCKDRARKIN